MPFAPSRLLLSVPSSSIIIAVDLALVLGLQALHGFGDLAVHGIDRIVDALATPAALVAIAALDRFARAGGRARGNGSATEAAILQGDIDLDRRIPAAVDHGTGVDVDDRGHGIFLRLFGLKDGAACRGDEPWRQ